MVGVQPQEAQSNNSVKILPRCDNSLAIRLVPISNQSLFVDQGGIWPREYKREGNSGQEISNTLLGTGTHKSGILP